VLLCDSVGIAGFVLIGVYNILYMILSTSHGIILGRRFARMVPKITFEEMVHEMMEYEFPDRDDNLICVAIVNQKAIIIKTVMVRWKLR